MNGTKQNPPKQVGCEFSLICSFSPLRFVRTGWRPSFLERGICPPKTLFIAETSLLAQPVQPAQRGLSQALENNPSLIVGCAAIFH